jgi:eIF-2B alpha/beta/delta-like uncharacterized protein
VESGKRVKVIACETRPRLQGAKLTVFELRRDGVPVTLITDNMVGYVMDKGMVSKVVVGADRVLRTGHVVNKIGTLTVAAAAHFFGIPFYVAAPKSTFDLESRVEEVVIEERSGGEVRMIDGCKIVSDDVPVLNPAFDITPPELITAIVCEDGIIEPPYETNITARLGLRRFL